MVPNCHAKLHNTPYLSAGKVRWRENASFLYLTCYLGLELWPPIAKTAKGPAQRPTRRCPSPQTSSQAPKETGGIGQALPGLEAGKRCQDGEGPGRAGRLTNECSTHRLFGFIVPRWQDKPATYGTPPSPRATRYCAV